MLLAPQFRICGLPDDLNADEILSHSCTGTHSTSDSMHSYACVGSPHYIDSWTPWAACGTTCGTSTQLRERDCLGDCGTTCPESRNETRSCSIGPSMTANPFSITSKSGFAYNCSRKPVLTTAHTGVPNAWDTWTAWTSCGTTCGVSTRTRSRTCIGDCGPACVGSDTDSEPCSVGA